METAQMGEGAGGYLPPKRDVSDWPYHYTLE